MISCHACKREYADTASFCPFCGAKPGDAAAGGQQPKSMIAEDQKTVALDISAMNLPPEEPKKTVAPAASSSFVGDAPVDRTVAMQVPAELLAEPAPAPAARKPPKRSGTILGMPGMTPGENPLEALKKPIGGGAALKAGLIPQSQGAGALPPVTSGASAGISGEEKTVAFNPAAMGLDSLIADSPAPAAPAPAAPVAQAPTPAAPVAQAPAAYPEPDATVAIQAIPVPATAPAPAPRAALVPQTAAAPVAAAAAAPMASPQYANAAPSAPQAKKKGGGKTLFIVVGVLLVAAIVAALVMLTSGGSMDSAVADTATKNIPGDVDGFGGLNLDRFRDSWVWEQFGSVAEAQLKERREVRMLMEKAGLELDSLHAISFGVYHRIRGNGDEEGIRAGGVLAISADLDLDKINAVLADDFARGKDDWKRDVEGTTFYGNERGPMAAAVEDTLIMAGPGLDRVEALMKTRGGEPSFEQNAELMTALNLVDKSAVFFGAITLNKDLRREMPRPAREFFKVGDWVATSVDFGSDDIVITMGAVMDADRVAKAVEQIEAGLKAAEGALESDLIPEEIKDAAKDVLDSIEVSHSDATLKITLTVPESLAKLIPMNRF